MSSITKPWVAGKRIIIAGAGMSGLAFARGLDRNWQSGFPRPEIIIYERDAEKVPVERIGYSMSIRSDAASGGMQALHKLGLLDDALQNMSKPAEGSAMHLWDTKWQSMLSIRAPTTPPDGLPTPHMRIARHVLRTTLINGLPESATVHWDRGCESAKVLPDGRVEVKLLDGSTDACDLLVVADGASSKIRTSLRPDDSLQFAGAVCISACSRFAPGSVPKPVNRDWGMVAVGDGNGLFAARIDDASAVWNLSYLADKPRDAVRGAHAVKNKDEILAEARRRGKLIGSPFSELVEATDPATLMIFNAMDKPPIKHSGDQPLIYIGDANHAVSPFAGNGANMALMDGLELAKVLASAESLQEACQVFDAESFPRSTRTRTMSHRVIAFAHATGWRLTLYTLLLRALGFFLSFKKSW